MNRFGFGIMRAMDAIRYQAADALQWPAQNIKVWINAGGVVVKAFDNGSQLRYMRTFDAPMAGTKPDSIENAMDWYRAELLLRQVEWLSEEDEDAFDYLGSADEDYYTGGDN